MKLKEKLMKNKLFRNFVVLLTGEGICSVFGLISFTLTIKAIGMERNGIILSIQTYCAFLYSIFGFKSFEGIVRYISIALEENDHQGIKNYIKQSYLFDISTSILTVIVGVIFINLYAHIINWDKWIIVYAFIYLFMYIFQLENTSIGILRVYGKFNYITYKNIMISFARLIICLIGFVVKGSFAYFFYMEVILFLLTNLITIILTYKTLKENDLVDFYKVKIKFMKDYIIFSIYNNISSTIDLPVNQITTMFINKYLGYADITVYKAFEKLGSIISKLGAPLNQIIYPEMNLLIAQKKYKRAKRLSSKLFKGISAIGILMIGGVLLTYKLWLGLLIPNYNGYIIPLITYFVFIVFVNGTVGVHSLFLALNYIKYNIPVLLIVNSAYLAFLYYLIQKINIYGVVIALLTQAIVVVGVKSLIMSRKRAADSC